MGDPGNDDEPDDGQVEDGEDVIKPSGLLNPNTQDQGKKQGYRKRSPIQGNLCLNSGLLM